MLKKFYVAIFLVCSMSLFSQKITISWESWEPYQFMGDNKKITGLDIEIAEAVMKKAGIAYELIEQPWKRAIEALKTGSLHMVLGASKTDERLAFALFSDAYRTESVNVFVRKGEAKKYSIKTLSDIKGSKFILGITRGYWYGDVFDELYKDEAFKKNTSEVEADAVNFRMLLGNRIDGFLADQYAGPSGLKKEGKLQYVEVLPVVVYSDDIYFMFSKLAVGKDVYEKICAALISLKADGTIDKILAKYIK